MSVLNWAHYWRNSLLDGESNRGHFDRQERNSHHQLDYPIFVRDKGDYGLAKELVAKLFADSEQNVIAVNWRPQVWCLKVEHGQIKDHKLESIITPLVVKMWLNRHGLLYPAEQVLIPRDLLQPQASTSFTIGAVEVQDAHISHVHSNVVKEQDVPREINDELQAAHYTMWHQFERDCQQLLNAVMQQSTGWEHLEESYIKSQQGWLTLCREVKGASQHIVKLYDDILTAKPKIPLFEQYANSDNPPCDPCRHFVDSIDERVGHSGDGYPLADAQRDALSHSLNINEGDMLAINGPPGTGKTTYVLSLVASLWVKAALRQSMPPVIFAASANNQAVTNIIDAFGKDFADGEGPLAGRWLPQLDSFGAYLPSTSKANQASVQAAYQTESFYKQVETQEYVAKAKQYFLSQAQQYYPEHESLTLEQVQRLLHQEMVALHQQLTLIKSVWSELSQAREVLLQLGPNPKQALSALQQEIAQYQRQAEVVNDDARQWKRYLANESIWLQWFAFIPLVKQKQGLLRSVYLEDKFARISQDCLVNLASEQWLDQLTQQAQQYQQQASELQQSYLRQSKWLENYTELEQRWCQLSRGLGVNCDGIATLDQVDKQADTKIRFKLFRLAVHYWEAAWLLASIALADQLENNTKTGKATLGPMWQRRMMLTPCIVSTFYMLPKYMQARKKTLDQFHSVPMYEFIDLLIVDEAGQVAPDIAGAAFSLAKKAVVIGDVHQIKPVATLCKQVDCGNLYNHNIMSASDQYDEIALTGKCVTSGSVMQIAQRASRYHAQPQAEQGMYLTEHRRCVDQIIDYCNKLTYKGLLQPKRGLADSNAILPPFAYLHINGRAQSHPSGSRVNELEAQTIVAWVIAQQAELEAKYGKPVADIVAVVTPFTAQASEIVKRFSAKDIAAGKEKDQLIVGTVHALQGAERPIVIFSPVYSAANNGGFIDSSSSLLNVAVSRAKDHFLVFGDMDAMSDAPADSPRGLLCEYLFAEDNQALNFNVDIEPSLRELGREDAILHDAKAHDDFLLSALADAKSSIHVVSPWLLAYRMKQVGYLDAIKQAIARGVSVHIYTDEQFNTHQLNQPCPDKQHRFSNAIQLLNELGVQLHILNRVHSKLVFVDSNCICIGSFNWFSAHRTKYANAEVSHVIFGDLAQEIDQEIERLLARKDNVTSNEQAVVAQQHATAPFA